MNSAEALSPIELYEDNFRTVFDRPMQRHTLNTRSTTVRDTVDRLLCKSN